MQLHFKGKSAIVTGACGGMGLEITKQLSKNNVSVLMLDIQHPDNGFLKKYWGWYFFQLGCSTSQQHSLKPPHDQFLYSLKSRAKRFSGY